MWQSFMQLPWWVWFLFGYALGIVMMNWLFTAELIQRDQELSRVRIEMRELRDALRSEQFARDLLLKELTTVGIGIDNQVVEKE
jgi:hypothetical protein